MTATATEKPLLASELHITSLCNKPAKAWPRDDTRLMGPLTEAPRQLLSSELRAPPSALSPGIDLHCPVARSAEEYKHTALNGADSHPGSLAAHQYWLVQNTLCGRETQTRQGSSD